MMENYHVPCGVGGKLEIISNAYLLLTLVKQAGACRGTMIAIGIIVCNNYSLSKRPISSVYGPLIEILSNIDVISSGEYL